MASETAQGERMIIRPVRPPFRPHIPGMPHYVYRCYDRDSDLLYVGCTVNVRQRMALHRVPGQDNGDWPAVIDHVTSERYPNRDTGRHAEMEAIWTEEPPCNFLRYELLWLAAHPSEPITHYLSMDEYDKRGQRQDHVDPLLAAAEDARRNARRIPA